MTYRLQLVINGSKCYTFIKSDLRTIQDLMDQIKRNFNIDMFTLFVNDSSIMPMEDIQVIHPNDIVVVRLNNVYHPHFLPQPETRTENKVKEKKSKKRKSHLPSTDTHEVDEVKKKKRKTDVFEPAATSSTKKDNVIESRIQYFNNLSSGSIEEKIAQDEECKELNIPHMDTEQVDESKKLVETHLKKCIDTNTSTPDLVTPMMIEGNKGGKKKKLKLSKMDVNYDDEPTVSQSEIQKTQESGSAIPSTSKAVDVQPAIVQNKQNNTNSKLILHITPARDIQPTTHLKKKINLVKCITVRNGMLVSEQNSTHSLPADIDTSNSSSNTSTKTVTTPARHEKTDNEDSPVDNVQKIVHQTSNHVTSSTDPARKLLINKTENSEIPSVESTPTQTNSSDKSSALTVKSTPNLPMSSMSYILSKLRDGEQGDTSNSKDSSTDRFITRRKRVRRKKKATNVHTDTPFPTEKLKVYRQPNVEAKPLMHKFFDDLEEDSEETLDNIDLTNSSPTQKEPPVIDATTANINDSMDTGTDIVQKVEVVNGRRTNGPSFLGRALTQETIDKLIIIKNDFVPRNGDVLVFQMLKMDATFSPTLSKYIIGEVKSFDQTSRAVELHIGEGLSEFQQPQGPLNATQEDANEEVEVFQTLRWEHLLQPRLLYP